ncbi:hypothetical protein [Sulfurospirillum arcachonense]|uniref:hypothetical protein n=1 Tax=Sulfurospirillum arcachonense TaxID=57666 RepID=UPI0004689E7B|nr:hypothetical protein [Sulfurospirillum arcachonense]
MNVKELSKIIGIPYTTIIGWKNSNDHRKIIYTILETYPKDKLIQKVESIKITFDINTKITKK